MLFQGAQGSRSLVPTLQTIRSIIQLPNPGSLKNPNKMCREDRGAFPLGSARGNNHVHSGSLRGLHQSSINLRPLLQQSSSLQKSINNPRLSRLKYWKLFKLFQLGQIKLSLTQPVKIKSLSHTHTQPIRCRSG